MGRCTRCAAAIVAAAALALAVLSVPAGALEPFGEADSQAVADALAASAGPRGDYNGSLEDAMYGVASLCMLSKEVESGKAALCELVSQAKMDAPESAHYAAVVAAKLECEGEDADAGAMITALTSPGSSLADRYHAAKVLHLVAAPVNPDALAPAADSLVDLLDDDGTFRGAEDSLDATAENAGLAYELLALLHRLGAPGVLERAVDVVSSVPGLLGGEMVRAGGPGGARAVLGDYPGGSAGVDARPSLSATSRVLAGLGELREALGGSQLPELDTAHMEGFARFLLGRRRPTGPGDAFHLLRALRAISREAAGALPRPLLMRLATPAVPSSSTSPSPPVARVSVAGVMGAPPPPGNSVACLGIARVARGSAPTPVGGGVIALRPFSSLPSSATAGGGEYLLDLPAGAAGEMGTYEVTLEARAGGGADGGATASPSVHTLHVTGALEMAGLRAGAVARAGAGGGELPEVGGAGGGGRGLLPDGEEVRPGGALRVEFRVASVATGRTFRPQQAFLRLVHHASGLEAFFPALPSGGEGVLSAEATPEGIAEQLGGAAGGRFRAALLVGDAAAAPPGILRDLGGVGVSHAPLADGSPAPPPPAPASEARARPLPEIAHQFRVPEPRPPKALSLAFACAAAAPLAWLAWAMRVVGCNLRGVPPAGTAGRWGAAGLHAGMAGVAGLLALFWVRLTFLQTLPLLVAGVTATSGFGLVALRALAAEREGAGAGGMMRKKD